MITVEAVGGDAIGARLARLPAALRLGLMRELTPVLINMQGTAKSEHLSGRPGLRRITGKLSGSIHYDLENAPGAIIGRLYAGREVRSYAGVHEYGGTFDIPAHMRRGPSGNTFPVRQHTATYPARSYLRSTLEEYIIRAEAAIQRAVVGSLRGV